MKELKIEKQKEHIEKQTRPELANNTKNKFFPSLATT
jgi:hypothetical protein